MSFSRFLGVLLLLAGAGLFIVAQQGLADYQTTTGQAARILSEEHQDRYNQLSAMRVAGGVGAVLGLFLVMVGGSSSSGPTRSQPPSSRGSPGRNQSTDSDPSMVPLEKMVKEKREQAKARSTEPQSSVYCPACGVMVHEQHTFCYGCGETLPDDLERLAANGRSTTDNGVTEDSSERTEEDGDRTYACPTCGQMNDSEWDVCFNCGDRLLVVKQMMEAGVLDTITCPKCEKLNPGHAKACRYCGRDL